MHQIQKAPQLQDDRALMCRSTKTRSIGTEGLGMETTKKCPVTLKGLRGGEKWIIIGVRVKGTPQSPDADSLITR